MKLKYRLAASAAALLLLSPVQAFAEEALPPGDLNGDTLINASDAADVLIAAAQLGAVGTHNLTEAQAAAADVNADGAVNASDAALILGYAAHVGSGGDLTFRLYLDGARRVDAVYLGVVNWGAPETKLENVDQFTYRFEVDGSEQIFRIDNSPTHPDGSRSYPVQNTLKQYYHFRLTVVGDTIIGAEQTETGLPEYTPPITGTPGLHTIRNFLTLAMEPIGTTVYMFGGGWNFADNGSVSHTQQIGVSPDWVRFWQEHDMNYTYRDKNGSSKYKDPPNSYYPYGGFNEYYYAGLDCSGFVSWVLYNTMYDVSGNEGFVGKSTFMAKRFESYGWGTWEHSFPAPDGTPETAMKPGDIMSMNGHVWISLGTCPDGSIVIAHSTPSDSHTGQPGGGPQIGAVGKSVNCQAYQLADRYMQTYFPDWCSRYKTTLKSTGYLSVNGSTETGRFRWNT
ncbi:MAG: hypothetical protein IKN55_05065, partial [Oscillospiraceae bacterium]|nr:hypothetical protein [Oscillospiraceae bacterium]